MEGISTEAYIDARTDAVRAQNDARFAEVLSEIRSVGTRIDHIEKGQISPWQVWAAALTVFGAGLAVLAFGGDQFGLGAGLAEQQAAQIERDKSQDAKLDTVLDRLDDLLMRQSPPAPLPPPAAD